MHSKSDIESQLSKVSSVSMQNTRIKSVQSHMVQPIMGNDPRVNSMVNQQSVEHRQQHRPQTIISMQNYPQNSAPPPPSNGPMRTNLITVPIQDTTITTHEIHSQQGHHYYPPPPPQVNYGTYNVPPPVSQTQQYYPQAQHPTQVSYVPQPPSQQQYVSSAPTSIRPSPTGYIQDPQYGPPPPQQPPPPQPQWSQHQQQFYR